MQTLLRLLTDAELVKYHFNYLYYYMFNKSKIHEHVR